MDLWVLLVIIFVAGAIGGLVNAWMTENLFLRPIEEDTGHGRVRRWGIGGNCFVSGVAACVSWGLYGPFASAYIIGGPAQTPGALSSPPGLTLAALVGAVLVGIGGARWLTNEVDKKLLRAAATQAATKAASEPLAAGLAQAWPAEALRLVRAHH